MVYPTPFVMCYTLLFWDSLPSKCPKFHCILISSYSNTYFCQRPTTQSLVCSSRKTQIKFVYELSRSSTVMDFFVICLGNLHLRCTLCTSCKCSRTAIECILCVEWKIAYVLTGPWVYGVCWTLANCHQKYRMPNLPFGVNSSLCTTWHIQDAHWVMISKF